MIDARIIERGRGSTLILIPGIQGRWEWMAAAVDALAARHRVLTFSLGVASGPHLFDQWVQHIDAMLAGAPERAATLVGVSFGGLVAARYAAERPEHLRRLVLVSSPSPALTLNPSIQRSLRRPRLSLPLFAAGSVARLWPEFRAACPSVPATLVASARHLWRVGRFPASPRLMAQSVLEWQQTDLAGGFRHISTPTLVLTGEPSLDRVVPVASSLEYLRLIPGAEHRTLRGAGHLGFILHTPAFAALVSDFIERSDARDTRPASDAEETNVPCT